MCIVYIFLGLTIPPQLIKYDTQNGTITRVHPGRMIRRTLPSATWPNDNTTTNDGSATESEDESQSQSLLTQKKPH